MDKKVTPSKWSRCRKWWGVALIPVAVLMTIFAFGTSSSSEAIGRNKVLISEVTSGSFQELIPVTANVEPERSIMIPALEGGRIDEVLVENGATVQAGQPLLKLSNATLMLDFMNRETQIIEQINNLRNIRITLKQTTRADLEALMEVEYQLEQMTRKFKMDTSLFVNEVIAEQEFEDSRDRYHYLSNRKNYLDKTLSEDRDYRAQQLSSIDNSIALMERNLQAIRANLENLTIKAPTAGQLSDFDHVVGETIAKGANVGRVDIVSNFIATAEVDEHYLGRIKQGQSGSFDLDGREWECTVRKVHPTIVNGQFEVELDFAATAPQDLRIGQTLQMRLSLSARIEAILLEKGSFYRKTQGNWVYVLENESRARRVEITLGRQNNKYFEVLSGLEPGQQVVVSSYDGFEGKELLKLE